jgi:hypothetical protein
MRYIDVAEGARVSGSAVTGTAAPDRFRELVDSVRRENPTGRGLARSEERLRYERKNALQTELIEDYSELLRVRADPLVPGSVVLFAPTLNRSVCHAKLSELSVRAQELVSAALASEATLDTPVSAPVLRRQSHAPLANELRKHIEAFEYDEAGKLIQAALRAGEDRPSWALHWLLLQVETLGDYSAAVQGLGGDCEGLSPRGTFLLARAEVEMGDLRRAARRLQSLWESVPPELYACFVAACSAREDLAMLGTVVTQGATQPADVRGQAARTFEELRLRLSARLRAEAEALNPDTDCDACLKLAKEIERLNPEDSWAQQVLYRQQQQHRAAHATALLAEAERLAADGEFGAARERLRRLRRRGPCPDPAAFYRLEEMIDDALWAAEAAALCDALTRDPTPEALLAVLNVAPQVQTRVIAESVLGPLLAQMQRAAAELGAARAVAIFRDLAALEQATCPWTRLDRLERLGSAGVLDVLELRASHCAATESVLAEVHRVMNLSGSEGTAAAQALRARIEVGAMPKEVLNKADEVVATLEGREAQERIESAGDAAAQLDAAVELVRRGTANQRRFAEGLIAARWRADVPPEPLIGCRDVVATAGEDGTTMLIAPSPIGVRIAWLREGSGASNEFCFATPKALRPVTARMCGGRAVVVGRCGSILEFDPQRQLPERYIPLELDIEDARIGLDDDGDVFVWMRVRSGAASPPGTMVVSLRHRTCASLPPGRLLWGTGENEFALIVDDAAELAVVYDQRGRAPRRLSLKGSHAIAVATHPGTQGLLILHASPDGRSVGLAAAQDPWQKTEWLDDWRGAEEVVTYRGPRDELVLSGNVAARRSLSWLRPSVFGFARAGTTELPPDSIPVLDGSRLVGLLRKDAQGYSATTRILRSDGALDTGGKR